MRLIARVWRALVTFIARKLAFFGWTKEGKRRRKRRPPCMQPNACLAERRGFVLRVPTLIIPPPPAAMEEEVNPRKRRRRSSLELMLGAAHPEHKLSKQHEIRPRRHWRLLLH